MGNVIAVENGYYTLINVFRVKPEDQKRMYQVILEATDIITKFPGYVSANVHPGCDGRHVANYAQWRTKNDFDSMRAHPDVQAHFQECRRLADIEPVFCEVAYTHSAGDAVDGERA